MLMPGRHYNADKYRFGFNRMEKDDEVKGVGNSYDFGARIYDPRIGRFLSIDPLYNKFPHQSPYHFAGNSPNILIDLFGEHGTIYIQVMTDKKGKPVIDKKTMNNIKKRIEEKGKELNVDWKVEIVYSNDLMTREAFETREGADEADSYIMIGRGQQLNKIVDKNRDENMGWENPGEYPNRVNGTSTDKLHYVNVDKMELINCENIFETKPYESVEEKTYLSILHEDGHPKFWGHSKNLNEDYNRSYVGHVIGTNTVMEVVPYEDKYDYEMVQKLQEKHGTIKEKQFQWTIPINK